MARHIKLSIDVPADAILHQTPGGKGIWNDAVFHVNEAVEECDCWVVYGEIDHPESVVCPPGNAILFLVEPPGVRRYHPEYVRQFGVAITNQTEIDHPNRLLAPSPLPWLVGRRQREGEIISGGMSYDELKAVGIPEKTRQLSIVCTTKRFTDGHRRRDDFVRELSARLGERLDVYGHGRNEVEDKWDALAPYKYTIAMESCAQRHFLTEKIADAFLAGCFPFYFGCPEVGDHYPQEAFAVIDVEDVDGAVALIEGHLRGNAWEEALPWLEEARELVLDKHNLFAYIAEFCSRLDTGPRREITVLPPPKRRKRRPAKHLKRLLGWLRRTPSR